MSETYLVNNYRIHIGIDPGVNTGFSVWDRVDKRFLCICTIQIHEAMARIIDLIKTYPQNVYVRYEDARLRTWFGNKTKEQLQGAGSIKRDCKIWQDFLESYGIPYASLAPRKGMTKWEESAFKQATGWAGRTDNHGRDSALLVYAR